LSRLIPQREWGSLLRKLDPIAKKLDTLHLVDTVTSLGRGEVKEDAEERDSSDSRILVDRRFPEKTFENRLCGRRDAYIFPIPEVDTGD
jgi:hypothetical protein